MFKLGYINKKTKLSIVKLLVLPKLVHGFGKIPNKILASPIGSQRLCGRRRNKNN